MAYARHAKSSSTFNVMFRFVLSPMFLFSGVFFPADRLPDAIEGAVWFSPLFHGVELVRGVTLGSIPATWMIHVACLVGLLGAGMAMAHRTFRRRLYA